MLDIISDSGGALSALSHKVDFIAGKSNEVAFDVATTEKDVRSILSVGAASQILMPATEAALESYSAANKAGHAEDDSAIVVHRLLKSLETD